MLDNYLIALWCIVCWSFKFMAVCFLIMGFWKP